MKYFIAALFFTAIQTGAQTHFEQGEICFKKQQYQEAKLLFEQHLKQQPNDLNAVEYLGDTQSHLGNWKSALQQYQKLKERKPTVAEYCYKYGGAMAMMAKESNVFKALSMVSDIKSAFEKALALNPKHLGARWALIELYIQLPSLAGGSEKQALRYSNELLKISAVDGYLSRGHIEEYYGRYPEAEKQYKKAIDIGNSATTYQKLANLYKNKMDQPEKAKQLLALYNEKNKS